MTVLSRTLAPSPAAAAPSSLVQRTLDAPETPFTRWLVRWRFWFFAALAVLVVIQFNGQWRIGLDSSIYRGVADNLAAGNGYVFAGRRQTQVYPGLPYLLAGFQKLFGTSLVPPLVLMNALALVTLAGVYQLIKRHYPLWVAVVVTCGVGMNARFLMQAQEIMTDMPFLCGVVWSMVAWDRLGRGRRFVGWGLVMATSLFLAAVMRPTFWVLAAAWGAAALWDVVRRRERRSLVALGVLAVVFAAFVLLDPRGRGLGLVSGLYEKQLMVILPDLGHRVRANAGTLFSREIPEAFFNEMMAGTGVLFSAIILGGCVLVCRRQPLWGLQVMFLTAIMLAISDVPRYYLMVLPTLWLGYVLAGLAVTSRFSLKYRDWTLFALFSVANVQNLGGALKLCTGQHATPFWKDYKRGTYLPAIEMAKLLRDRLGPNDVAIGPGAQVLAYFSGRQVLNGRLMGFDAQKPSHYDDLVAAARPRYVVGPVGEYKDKDIDLYRLMLHRVIVPGTLVAKTKDLWLAEVGVTPPAGDWRQTPAVDPKRVFPLAPPKKQKPTPEQAAAKQRKAEKAAKAAKTAQKERAKAKAQRKAHQNYLKRQARKKAAAAATQPGGRSGRPPADPAGPTFASAFPPLSIRPRE